LDKCLKQKENLEEWDIGKILLNLINRKRFEYRIRDIIEYIC
jgi:hypothetical protein